MAPGKTQDQCLCPGQRLSLELAMNRHDQTTDDRPLRIRQRDLYWREIDGQVFALDGRTWDYLSLNESGRLLWDQLAEGATVAELVRLLVDEYGIDSAVAQADVQTFVALLSDKELLTD